MDYWDLPYLPQSFWDDQMRCTLRALSNLESARREKTNSEVSSPMLFQSPVRVQVNWRSSVHRPGYPALCGDRLPSRGHSAEALNLCRSQTCLSLSPTVTKSLLGPLQSCIQGSLLKGLLGLPLRPRRAPHPSLMRSRKGAEPVAAPFSLPSPLGASGQLLAFRLA